MTERLGIIGSIVAKDLKEFSRDRFFVFVTILGLVFYVAIYWILPTSVDETIDVGVHQRGLDLFFGQFADTEGVGLNVVEFESSEALRAAVEGEGDGVALGLDFPEDFAAAVASGEPSTVRVLLTSGVPDEYRTAMAGFVREIAFAAAGEVPPVTQPLQEEIVLGEDRAGDQVSMRERMGPLFVFFVLLVETFALAALVAGEIQTRTVTAVLVTPARVSDFLAAKSVIGTLLAFGEALLLVMLFGLLGTNSAVLVVTLLLGAILVTGFGLIAGSSGRDFIGIVFWSMLFMLPLAVPAFAALFPGTAAAWVMALPTYGLVQGILRITGYGEGFGDVLPYLAGLALWCVAAFGVGLAVLQRKVATL